MAVISRPPRLARLIAWLAAPDELREFVLGDLEERFAATARQSGAERQIERGQSSVPELLDWRRSLTSFSELAAIEFAGGTLTGHGDARGVEIMRVTSNLPEVGDSPGFTDGCFCPTRTSRDDRWSAS